MDFAPDEGSIEETLPSLFPDSATAAEKRGPSRGKAQRLRREKAIDPSPTEEEGAFAIQRGNDRTSRQIKEEKKRLQL